MLLDRPGNPWVLISLSTTQQGQAAVLPMMMEAVGSLPVRGLLTLGGVLPPESVRAPSNVTVRGHVPHAAVLASHAIREAAARFTFADRETTAVKLVEALLASRRVVPPHPGAAR